MKGMHYMKLTKKITAAVLSIICAFSLLIPAYGASDISAVSIMMGDLNYDGKITAKDARIALRVAARLEENKYDINSYDADGNGKIGPADARIILRVAARLQNFNIGFDKNNMPNALNAFTSKRFSADISFAQEMTMKLTMYNDDFYINIGKIDGMPISGVLFIGDKMYMAGDLTAGETSALEIPENMYNEIMPDNERKEFIENLSLFVSMPDKFDEISEVKLNGETAILYSAFNDGVFFGLYTDTMGIPIKEVYGTYTETASGYSITPQDEIGFGNFTGNVDTAIFDINNYTVI